MRSSRASESWAASLCCCCWLCNDDAELDSEGGEEAEAAGDDSDGFRLVGVPASELAEAQLDESERIKASPLPEPRRDRCW